MFKQEDLAKYLGLKKVMAEGFFDIKGEAVIPAASCLLWFNDLEKKIRDNIEKPSIKPIGKPTPIKGNDK